MTPQPKSQHPIGCGIETIFNLSNRRKNMLFHPAIHAKDHPEQDAVTQGSRADCGPPAILDQKQIKRA